MKPHNASDMQRGKKADVENYGKACDARRKTENKGLAACTGVTACVGGDKMRKNGKQNKSDDLSQNSASLKCWTLESMRPMLDAGIQVSNIKRGKTCKNHAIWQTCNF